MSNHMDTDTPTASTLAQVQQRLLNLMTQLDAMQSQLQRMANDTRQNSDQVTALTHNLVDPNAAQATHDQLAELAMQMETQRTQLETLTQTVAQVSSSDQLAELAQKVAHQEHLDNLAHTVAKQEQMERLIQMVASEEQLTELLDTVKNLSRTQYKANALAESKDTRIAESLAALQEMAARREARQSAQTADEHERLDELRRNARAELTADFLPAIDGIERAIESGRNLLDQMIERREERRAVRRRRMAARQQAMQSAQQPPSENRGWFRRLFSAPEAPAVTEPNIPPPMPPEDANERLDTANIEAVESWLEGLHLVRDRFMRLLAAEDIHAIPALDQRFDPRLHTAVESELREDVPPETIVRVIRTGYQQGEHVLRYAEVVVARSATDTDEEAEPTPAAAPDPDRRPTTIAPMAGPLTTDSSDTRADDMPIVRTETIRGERETTDHTPAESVQTTESEWNDTTDHAPDGAPDESLSSASDTDGATTDDETTDDEKPNGETTEPHDR